MSIYTLLILMLFAHIVDDYYLQGVLANLKQKCWWKEHHSEESYRYDYIVGLIVHSLSWSIMILLPIFAICSWNPPTWIYVMLAVNMIVHAITDDAKANKRSINLIADQSIHFLQIMLTWILWAAIVVW